jgi:ADP-ribosylglycohydrolase
VIRSFDAGITWEEARDDVERRYGAYSWVHAVDNAAVVAAALLWGEGDYSRTIGLAVQGGWDTDCNGATAGSAFGAMHGRDALPVHWVAPLNNTVRSAILGFDRITIDELAARTARLGHDARSTRTSRPGDRHSRR